MRIEKILTIISSVAVSAGAVMSLINSATGHGIATDEDIHEYVAAQAGGDSPHDLTSPGTGDGGGTGTPDEEKKYYKKASRLADIGERITYTANDKGIVVIKGYTYKTEPYSKVILEIEGFECKDSPNAWSYCDTRLEGRSETLIFGTGTEEPPTPPAP